MIDSRLEEKMMNDFLNGYEKDKNAKEVKIKHVCEYTTMLNEYQQWLEKEKLVIYRDCGHTQNAITKCYDKLIEIRKKYERGDIDERCSNNYVDNLHNSCSFRNSR